MAVYIGLLCFVLGTCLLSMYKELKPKYFLFLSFLAMTLVLGLRGVTVGEDTSNYIQIIERAAQMSWGSILADFPKTEWQFISYGGFSGYSAQIETVFLACCKLLMKIFHNAQAVIFVIAAITSILIARFIRDNVEKNSDIYLVTIVYMCESMFMNSFNLSRQMLAMGIAVQALACVRNRKFKRAIVILAAAIMIHMSAIVAVIPVLLLAWPDKKFACRASLIAAAAAVPAIPLLRKIVAVLLPAYLEYFEVNYWKPSLNGTIILWLIIVALLILMWMNRCNGEEELWLSSLMMLYLSIEIIGLRYVMIGRVASYFRLFIGLFLCQGEKTLSWQYKVLFRMGIVLLVCAAFLRYAASPARLYVPFWQNVL